MPTSSHSVLSDCVHTVQNKATKDVLNKCTSQIRKPSRRKTSPLNWFPRKKGDSYLARKIKLLQVLPCMVIFYWKYLKSLAKGFTLVLNTGSRWNEFDSWWDSRRFKSTLLESSKRKNCNKRGCREGCTSSKGCNGGSILVSHTSCCQVSNLFHDEVKFIKMNVPSPTALAFRWGDLRSWI